jgi:hypothetical protein
MYKKILCSVCGKAIEPSDVYAMEFEETFQNPVYYCSKKCYRKQWTTPTISKLESEGTELNNTGWNNDGLMPTCTSR